MNIDQRIRLIVWPVTFFLFINTLAINLFVFFHLADVEGSPITAVYRIFTLIFSIAVSLKIYLWLKVSMDKEHEGRSLRMHLAHSISLFKAITVIVEDFAIGLVQAFFVFVSSISFWVIVNFTEGTVSTAHAILFYAGFVLILLASAYVLLHRLGLAVLSIRK